MNPVVGLDVAKGESQVQAFLDKSKPFGKSYSMKHTREDLDRFIGFLHEIEVMTGQMPIVILESTGHYHFLLCNAWRRTRFYISCLTLLFLIKRRDLV